ncbi:hypothetical protein KXV85_002128, partial [Aspergillus fumigatus]
MQVFNGAKKQFFGSPDVWLAFKLGWAASDDGRLLRCRKLAPSRGTPGGLGPVAKRLALQMCCSAERYVKENLWHAVGTSMRRVRANRQQYRSTVKLILDSAARFRSSLPGDNADFAGKLREWLKTLRKKNASVIFATQSLADIDGSSIAPAIIESCPNRILLPNDREPRRYGVA